MSLLGHLAFLSIRLCKQGSGTDAGLTIIAMFVRDRLRDRYRNVPVLVTPGDEERVATGDQRRFAIAFNSILLYFNSVF